MVNVEFLEKLSSGRTLVSDGATGTNLQKMGLPVGAAAETWVLERPDAISDLNRSFIEAGADIILTCTFGATKMRLAASKMIEDYETINHRAVEITKAAADEFDVLVAGSIGPTGEMLEPMGTMTIEAAEADFRDQAKLLSDDGVDLIVIETQFDLNEAVAAVRGVRAADGDIPLVCSFSFDRGTRTMMGVKPEDFATTIGALDVDLLGINCGRSLEDNLACLAQLSEATDKPIWFKPNAGLPGMDDDGLPTYAITPEAMAAQVNDWLAAGARVIGGCCGTSPDHLAAIARAAKD